MLFCVDGFLMIFAKLKLMNKPVFVGDPVCVMNEAKKGEVSCLRHGWFLFHTKMWREVAC